MLGWTETYTSWGQVFPWSAGEGGVAMLRGFYKRWGQRGEKRKRTPGPFLHASIQAGLFHILRRFHLKNYQFDPIALIFRWRSKTPKRLAQGQKANLAFNLGSKPDLLCLISKPRVLHRWMLVSRIEAAGLERESMIPKAGVYRHHRLAARGQEADECRMLCEE